LSVHWASLRDDRSNRSSEWTSRFDERSCHQGKSDVWSHDRAIDRLRRSCPRDERSSEKDERSSEKNERPFRHDERTIRKDDRSAHGDRRTARRHDRSFRHPGRRGGHRVPSAWSEKGRDHDHGHDGDRDHDHDHDHDRDHDPDLRQPRVHGGAEGHPEVVRCRYLLVA
jgi:hypothetical protein